MEILITIQKSKFASLLHLEFHRLAYLKPIIVKNAPKKTFFDWNSLRKGLNQHCMPLVNIINWNSDFLIEIFSQ